MSDIPTRVADLITTYTRSIILVVLVLTVAIGVGMTEVEQQSQTEQFETESPAADAQEFIEQNFTIQEQDNEALVQIIQRDENVLTKDALLESLSFQQEIRDNERIGPTLVEERPVVGYANVIANAALTARGTGANGDTDGEGGPPTLADQRAAIESLDGDELEAIIQDVLGEDGNPQALGFMPASYEPGSTTAQSGSTIVRQEIDVDVQDPNAFPQELTDAQLEIRDLAQDRDSQYSLFGFGILSEEISQSLGDSGAIVGPLALLFVVLALTIAYRDLLDIVLGVVGILSVLVWTFGFMGWAGVAFNQLLLSVPVLLIGLSIDYAIHVFMRHREQRADGGDTVGVRRSMSLALAGVGAALLWVTATAAIGFLANLTSPIGPLQDFGIVSAFGVVAALVIFGTLIPALKIELDSFLESRGFDREKRAFGTGGSAFSRVLGGGVAAARRFPVVVVVVALLLSLGGAYGATQVDTSFDETDFLADSPPEWTQNLPGPMAPGTYQINEDLEFIGENYQQEDNEAEVLIRGDVTDDRTLRWLEETSREVADLETLFVGPNGPDVTSPLSVMQRTATRGGEAAAVPEEERTERQAALVEFANAFEQAAGEDGVPDGNVEALFDRLLAANPQAAEFVYRVDGEYEALRLQFGVTGDARIDEIADDNRDVAAAIEDASGGALTATPGGDQVIFDTVQKDLLDTVIQGLLITLVAVFIFLAVAYRLTGSPASLGVVTLVPVALAVTWILGSMWVMGIPFNTLTGTITSLTVGLGIAYSIHISSRYELELRRQGDVWEAMYTTVTGTGGALLGSAATTVGGFGTLAFAILPILRQFGIITGLTIVYAFLASVLVLPSLLILWTRYFGPSGYFPDAEEDTAQAVAGGDEQPAADGGSEAP
jgi:hydrophobe/amphiphile efflux-3 (HAE3) family protein